MFCHKLGLTFNGVWHILPQIKLWHSRVVPCSSTNQAFTLSGAQPHQLHSFHFQECLARSHHKSCLYSPKCFATNTTYPISKSVYLCCCTSQASTSRVVMPPDTSHFLLIVTPCYLSTFHFQGSLISPTSNPVSTFKSF